MNLSNTELLRQYAETPIVQQDAVPAWLALRDDTSRTYLEVAKKLDIQQVHDQPYVDAWAMFRDMSNGLLKVSVDHADHPVWSNEDNIKFRVVHDYYHFCSLADFSLQGELDTFQFHAARLAAPGLTRKAREALYIEVYVQALWKIVYDEFPVQKVFTLSH